MGKKVDKRDREQRDRRRLARAEVELQIAQEERRLAMNRGERAVEKAHQRADRWLEKATRRVERRAGTVARLEARLTTVLVREHPAAAHLSPMSPQAAAEHLEEIEEAHFGGGPGGSDGKTPPPEAGASS